MVVPVGDVAIEGRRLAALWALRCCGPDEVREGCIGDGRLLLLLPRQPPIDLWRAGGQSWFDAAAYEEAAWAMIMQILERWTLSNSRCRRTARPALARTLLCATQAQSIASRLL